MMMADLTKNTGSRARPLTLALLGLLGCAASAAETGENWPQYRGPHADGSTRATGLPLTFGDTRNVLWQTPVHGKAWSSPVVWNHQIWMTTATKDGSELGAVCVDAESGKIVHDVVVFRIDQPLFCHPMNSYGTPTPVIEQGRIYVHFGSYGTACLDTATAKTLWTRQDLRCDHFRGPASSPILAGNLLVLTFDGVDVQFLAALDKTSGKTAWQRDRHITYDTEETDYHKGYSTPALITVGGQTQLVSPSAGATIAYAPLTGEEIWRVRSGGMNAAALPLFGNGLVYVTTAAGGYQLFAVRPDGRGDVTDTHVAWKFDKNVPSRPSQILLGGRLFMISDKGMVSCVNAKSGESVWQKRLGGAFSASPLLADGHVYFFGEAGEVPVVAATDSYKLLANNQLGDGFMASPAVYGHSLILRSRTCLYRIGERK